MKTLFISFCIFFLCGCAGLDEQNKQPPINKYVSYPTESITKNELIELETRKYKNGFATQKFIFLKPKNPVASVILFEGGVGQLELGLTGGKPQPSINPNGFLVRNRVLFARHGLNVAVIDSPSDLPNGLYQMDRISDRHTIDMKAVIDFLKKSRTYQFG